MKNNFIELTTDDGLVLINLLNVTRIKPSEGKTLIYFNFYEKTCSSLTYVNEEYEKVKSIIGI